MKNFSLLICLMSFYILCHSAPQFDNIDQGAIKTTAQLKEVCETQFEFSRWINDRCYYFYNKEVASFDDVQKICSDTFKQHGFENGRLYEPRDAENFVKIYRLAEDFSQKRTLQLWLGLNDKENDGEFVYSSNGKLPKINAPWAGSQPNGGLIENCLTTFIPDNDDSPRWYDRPCVEENDSVGDVGHKFMCQCNVPDQNPLDQQNSGLWKPDGSKGECGTRNTLNNIVCSGNCDASIGEFPWMALLGYDYERYGYGTIYTCGGSLINKWYVLTAAHCVANTDAELSEIVLGEHKIGADPDCQSGSTGNRICQPKKIVRRAAKIFVHENYDKVTVKNDIALIRLNEAVPLFRETPSESSANPICLPWSEDNPLQELKEGKQPTVSGWGRIRRKETIQTVENLIKLGAGSKVLRAVRVPIANKEKCERQFTTFDHKTQVCAGGEIGTDSCGGDSGGPLVAREFAGDPWYQNGLVSFGTKFCGVNTPAVYTKVAAYLSWIESKLKP